MPQREEETREMELHQPNKNCTDKQDSSDKSGRMTISVEHDQSQMVYLMLVAVELVGMYTNSTRMTF